MGVYIKDIEMPFCCLVCPCSGTDDKKVWVCEASKLRQITTEDKIERRPEWCPLVSVPKHGDLIDRKTAYDSLLNGMVMTGYQSRALDCIAEYSVPTTIPADGTDTDVPTREGASDD